MNLDVELREAIKEREEAQEDLEIFEREYKEDRAVRRDRLAKATKRWREIEHEWLTGETGLPVLDTIRRNGQAAARAAGKPPAPPEEPESADERQRGPTAAPKTEMLPRIPTMTRVKSKDRSPRKPKTERADRREVVISPKGPIRQEQYIGPDPVKLAEDHLAKLDTEANSGEDWAANVSPAKPVQWTSADLEEELEDACYPPGFTGPGSPWPELKEHGCDDRKILEVLRQIWPASYRMENHHTGSVGRTVHGGPTPAFWVGARKSTDWKIAPPTLEGLRLADRVRTVLEIPRASTFGGKAEPKPQPGSLEALEAWGKTVRPETRFTSRVCNRCHLPRIASVGLCPNCGSPEFRPYLIALAEAKGEKPSVPTAEATAADKQPVRKRRKAAAL